VVGPKVANHFYVYRAFEPCDYSDILFVCLMFSHSADEGHDNAQIVSRYPVGRWFFGV
jgi:hypothetical protein